MVSPFCLQSSPCPSHEDVEVSPSASSEISMASSSQTDASVSPSISMSQEPSPGCQVSASATSQPVYNKQVADSCIVRVSIECGNNGNVYKSILVRRDGAPLGGMVSSVGMVNRITGHGTSWLITVSAWESDVVNAKQK